MNIKPFLERNNLSQTELANKLGIKQATISYWMSGKSVPSAAVLKQLIFMGMTIGEVFDAETEALIMKGKRLDKKKMCADIVETALYSLVKGRTDLITNKDACRQIVEIGLKELLDRKNV